MNCTSLERSWKCDGNGQLCISPTLPEEYCICDAGWTSLGDFSVVEGANCSMHEMSLRALEFIDMIQASVYLIVIIRYLFVRSTAVRHIGLDSFTAKSLCPIFFFFFGVTDFTLSFLKIGLKEPQIIGRDLAVSTMQTLFNFFCFSSLTLYFQMILKFLKGYARLMTESKDSMKRKFKILQSCSWLVLVLSLPVSIAPLKTMFPPADDVFILAQIEVIGVGSLVFIYGLLFITALRCLLTELHLHLEIAPDCSDTSDIRLVCQRLKFAYYIGGAIIIGGSAPMIVFGTWSYLLKKISYILILVRVIGIPLFGILITTLSKITVSKKFPTVATEVYRKKSSMISMISVDTRAVVTAVEEVSASNISNSNLLRDIQIAESKC